MKFVKFCDLQVTILCVSEQLSAVPTIAKMYKIPFWLLLIMVLILLSYINKVADWVSKLKYILVHVQALSILMLLNQVFEVYTSLNGIVPIEFPFDDAFDDVAGIRTSDFACFSNFPPQL